MPADQWQKPREFQNFVIDEKNSKRKLFEVYKPCGHFLVLDFESIKLDDGKNILPFMLVTLFIFGKVEIEISSGR